MRSSLRYLTTFAFTTLALVIAGSGCSSIGEAIDCDQMCNRIQDCIDSDIDVHDCAERCEDKAENDAVSEQLDDCTDCLDHDYSCAEIPDRCGACQELAYDLVE